MRKAMLVASVVAVLATLFPAQAGPSGCTAAAAVDLIMAGSCRYVATGPGEYTAATTNQWRIDISKDKGASWHFVAGHASPALPEQGSLPTVAGDWVNVAIAWPQACQPNPLPPGCHKLARAGVVSANDV